MKSHQEETRQQHDSELREFAQLLDTKAARIKKLEGQLKDIAYGTRQYKLDTSKFEYESCGSALEESIELERGQNLFQFHISQVMETNVYTDTHIHYYTIIHHLPCHLPRMDSPSHVLNT